MAINRRDDEYFLLEPDDEPDPHEEDYMDIFLEQFDFALDRMATVYSVNRGEKGDSWRTDECSVEYLRDKLREEMTEWWATKKGSYKEINELTDILNVGLMLLTKLVESPRAARRQIDHSLRR
jgi:hypothetical protein